MRPIVVLGATGQVGRGLALRLGAQGAALSRGQADLTQPESLPGMLDAIGPRAIINVAAYTQVDKAEAERDLAFMINGEAPGVLAEYCRVRGIPFVHFSTDYVFDGLGDRPWREDDLAGPLSVYGKSKLEGERRIEAQGGQYLILRTSWVYDAAGKNFLTTILRVAQEKGALRIVNDQRGTPNYAPWLAQACLEILERAAAMPRFPSGLYHVSMKGYCSWYEFGRFACEIAVKRGLLRGMPEITAIPTREYPTPAKRPLNSMLDCTKAEQIFMLQRPPWEEGLGACMETMA